MTAAAFIRPRRHYGGDGRPTVRARAGISSPQTAAEPSRTRSRKPSRGRCAVNGKQLLLARRIVLSASLAAAVAALLVAPAVAQGYPNRPVKIVIPFAPGGPTEFIIRLVADRLTATLGQAFVIENRPGGAGGTVGAKSVAVAEPDGYTLLFSSPGPLVTAAAVYKNLDYDPIKSFAPIAMLIYAPQMLVVHPSVPANSLPRIRRLREEQSGQDHVRIVRLRHAAAHARRNAQAGRRHQHHPRPLSRRRAVRHRSGGGPGADDLRDHRHSPAARRRRRLRALAVATETRSPLLPDVPTTAESGYPKLLASFWSGLLAPAGTPARDRRQAQRRGQRDPQVEGGAGGPRAA